MGHSNLGVASAERCHTLALESGRRKIGKLAPSAIAQLGGTAPATPRRFPRSTSARNNKPEWHQTGGPVRSTLDAFRKQGRGTPPEVVSFGLG